MVGIKHHTPAAGRGIKIAKSSYNEEHDPGAIADVLTDHNLAAHTALGLAVENSANATTLDGLDSTAFVKVSDHTKAAHEALNLTPTSHGNEVHTSTFITDTQLAAALSGYENPVGLVTGISTLWNPNKGNVPDGYRVVDNLGNFLVIEYIGGEQQDMNITHSVSIIGAASVTVTLKDVNTTAIITHAATSTIYGAITNPADAAITVSIANATGSPITWFVTATDPETNQTLFSTTNAIADSTTGTYTFTLPKACNIVIGSD